MNKDTNYFNINAITQSINISKSDKNTITIELPYPYMRVDPIPTNNNPNNYSFITTVRGKIATITKNPFLSPKPITKIITKTFTKSVEEDINRAPKITCKSYRGLAWAYCDKTRHKEWGKGRESLTQAVGNCNYSYTHGKRKDEKCKPRWGKITRKVPYTVDVEVPVKVPKSANDHDGWKYDIQMNAYYNKVKINVGPSKENSKTIELPHYNMLVDPIPINKQEDHWKEIFDTKVNGKTLTVTRIDDNTKTWAQKLELYAYFDHEPIFNVYPYLESVSSKLNELFTSLMGKTHLLNYIHNDDDVKKYIDKVNNNIELSRYLTKRLSDTKYMSGVHSEKIKIIQKNNDDIDVLVDDINNLNDVIKKSEEKIKNFNINDNKQEIINETNKINERIIDLRVKENVLLQNIRYSRYENKMKINDLNDIQDISKRNDKSYKGVSLRYMQDENKKNMNNIINTLDKSVNELNNQTKKVYRDLSNTDRLKNSKNHLQNFDDLKQRLNKVSQVSENFSNYTYKEGMDNNNYENKDYSINYLNADYKDILLTPEECEKLPEFDEKIQCNENNYKANNTKCMSKVLCDNSKLSMELNNNQTNSSQDELQYNDQAKFHNVHYIHSINLIVGILSISYIISKK